MKLFSIHDSKAEFYLPPMMLRNKGEAIRQVEAALRQSDTNIAQDPESFTLLELGEYDQDKGIITPHKQHIIIGNASEFLKQ